MNKNIIFYMLIVSSLFAQNTICEKDISMNTNIKLRLEVLGARLSSGSYQTENGKFEYPINITLNKNKLIEFNIFINCDKNEINKNIAIIKDQIEIVFSGIQELLDEENIDLELENCVEGKLYNYYSPVPIGYWKGTSLKIIE